MVAEVNSNTILKVEEIFLNERLYWKFFDLEKHVSVVDFVFSGLNYFQRAKFHEKMWQHALIRLSSRPNRFLSPIFLSCFFTIPISFFANTFKKLCSEIALKNCVSRERARAEITIAFEFIVGKRKLKIKTRNFEQTVEVGAFNLPPSFFLNSIFD